MAERPPRVLFVDDEPNILRTLRRLCRHEPYEVLTAASGPEALDILRETPASVIISDYRMPDMTGVEMLARAKEIVPHSIRMILSGYADTEAVLESINKGEVYRFLPKPWDDQELLTTIAQGLEHWQLKLDNEMLEEQLLRQNRQLIRLNEDLEVIVAERTRSLSFAQEVLEGMPVAVLGISREGEVMLANSSVSRHWPELGRICPGTDIDEVLPEEAQSLVRACLEDGRDGEGACKIGDRTARLDVNRLVDGGTTRGCVLVLDRASVRVAE